MAARHRPFLTLDLLYGTAATCLVLSAVGISDMLDQVSVLVLGAVLITAAFAWAVFLTDPRQPFEVCAGQIRLPYGAVQRQIACGDLISLRRSRRFGADRLTIETKQREFTIHEQELVPPWTLRDLEAAILREVSALPNGPQRVDELRRFARADSTFSALTPRATHVLCGLLWLIFACQAFMGGDNDLFWFLRFGANAHTLVAEGQWYRTLTANLLHADFHHAAGNTLALLAFGTMVERGVGSARLIVIFLASAFGGALASHAAHVAPLSLGASTGVLGVIAAWVVAWFTLPEELKRRGRTRPFAFLTNIGIWMLLSLLAPQVDHAAHAGGFAAGIVVTWSLTGWSASSRFQASFHRASAVLLIALYAGAAAQSYMRTPLEQRRDTAIVLSDGLGLMKGQKPLPPMLGNAAELGNWAFSILQQWDALPEELTLAVEIAERAVALSGEGTGYELDSLATAYFRVGEIDKAIDTERKALRNPTRFFASQMARFLRAQTARGLPFRADNHAFTALPGLTPLASAEGAVIEVRSFGPVPSGTTLFAIVFDKQGPTNGVLHIALPEQLMAGSTLLPIVDEAGKRVPALVDPGVELWLVDREPAPHASAKAQYFPYDESVDRLP